MIETASLFPLLDQELIELLKSLSPDDWNKKTVAKLWTVKDVATHLLDGNLRTISTMRDQHQVAPDREIHSYSDLVAYLNEFNADWVKATRRLSPAVLIDLLETTGKQYSEIMRTQDLDADAIFSVAWAGEQVSKNWFHIAREYTEKWHHQQQIREAVNKPGIMTKTLFYPLIETFLHGLPHTYRTTDAPNGTAVNICILLGEEMHWYLIKSEEGWQLKKEFTGEASSKIHLPADTAWKLFTKAMSPAEALETISITGNQSLGQTALKLIAVMA
ncbi:maleylpyruvate isomerase N-terminal domain-containing protein [Dyadobacter arcticus]|uniref:Uncharacterized protein (TIGR03083 family) n=1 Tax=Dyadobacter arcticus TaxID=1078754 RepID=A0ABX0UQ84_9BACT|nr:maleylpyruvate isomerase N-terminal domain-containing protein [Dyadobacter arcticus]NIJ54284.1 uncharacterized protein (TIGR03083 family) [Dyadobacter arcticus]